MTISNGELVLRLLVAFGLCGLIGLEREAREEVAGLKTHTLVGVGSALFTLVSAYGFSEFRPQPDPGRIAAQIVSGIGFLGAGAILRQGLSVRGLTTAASLWGVAAIGMAAGAGFYVPALATTVIVMFTLVVMRAIRPTVMSVLGSGTLLVNVELGDQDALSLVVARLVRHSVRVSKLDSARSGDVFLVDLELRVPPDTELAPVLAEIENLSGVNSCGASNLAPRRLGWFGRFRRSDK